MPLRQFPRGLWISIGLIVLSCFLLIGLQVYQVLGHMQDLRNSRQWVVHTFQVITTAQSLDRAVQDTERSASGYLITGNDNDLIDYRGGVEAIPAQLDRLQRLTVDNPQRQGQVRQLRTLIDAKLHDAAAAVQARDQGGFTAAVELLRRNVPVNRNISMAVDDIVDAEDVLLRERLTRAEQAERASSATTLSSVAIIMGMMLLGVLLTVSAMRNLIRLRGDRRASERRFDLLVDGVTDHAICMLDAAGHVTEWNRGAERIKGYAPSEIIGQHFSVFYTPEDRDDGLPERSLQKAVQLGRYEADGWRTRRDGQRFFANVVVHALRNDAGRLLGFAKITRDMTERLAQQHALEQTRAALAQSQKMEALGQLSGGIAHDFNNLVHVIKSAVTVVQRRLTQAEADVHRYLDMIGRNADHAAQLTQRLLAFARRQPLDPRPIQVNKLVASMAELLRHTLGESIALEAVLGSGTWRVSVDANQLESALLNLAVNARDAMPAGGKLTIETSNAHLDEAYARAHGPLSPGQYVLIAVSDTGSGMSPEVIARAFEPFFTTKDIGKGTGLGLSQVHGFLKQSGGHIAIYSEPGEGTTIKLYLPRHHGEDTGGTDAAASLPALANAGETVLVVEDEADVRNFTVETLTQLGYRVLSAVDGHQALQILAEAGGVDLLFTDVGLPNGPNGRQLADEAQRRWPNIRVLYTTGYARNAIIHHGRLDPGVQLLVKPFSESALGRKIREVLDQPPGGAAH